MYLRNGIVPAANAAVVFLEDDLQHFAAAFSYLPGTTGRTVCLFLYRTRSGAGLEVVERRLPGTTGTARHERRPA